MSINSHKYLDSDREELYKFLVECVVFGGYKCYMYDNDNNLWGYVIKDNHIVSIQPYFGGFSYSFCYIPSKNAGSSCQCFFSNSPIDAPRPLNLQTLALAFEGGYNFARHLNANLYQSWLFWFNKNYFKNELVEIKGDGKNV